MIALEGRIVYLELMIQRLQMQVGTLRGQVGHLETQTRQVPMVTAPDSGAGSGSGGAPPGFIGKAAVNIDARSGTSLAAGGQVNIYYDSSGTLTAAGTNVIARCAVSRTTAAGHGIDSGSYCWVERDGDGTWWASPLDCT